MAAPGNWNNYDRLGDVLDALAGIAALLDALEAAVLQIRDRLPAALDGGRLAVRDTGLL